MKSAPFYKYQLDSELSCRFQLLVIPISYLLSAILQRTAAVAYQSIYELLSYMVMLGRAFLSHRPSLKS